MATWPQLLRTLLAGSDLDSDSAAWAMNALLAGEATDAQIGGFLAALRAKGESGAEVETFVEVMLAHARRVEHVGLALDIVGTGGDQSNSVNISTMSALVAAAAGATVIKHGNRAASSATGTADVLEELGVQVMLEPSEVAASVRRSGIGFCFAPMHHPAMRHVGPSRRDLGVPTVFNLLGPLANPGGAQAALIGVADVQRAPVMADVLRRRGVRALVVRGDDGLDELSTSTTSTVWDCTGDELVVTALDPRDLGIAPIDRELLVGGDRVRNAALLRKALAAGLPRDEDAARVEAIRDVVALNSAAALVAYRAAEGRAVQAGLVERIAAELPRTRELIETGAALAVLDRWAATTAELVAAR